VQASAPGSLPQPTRQPVEPGSFAHSVVPSHRAKSVRQARCSVEDAPARQLCERFELAAIGIFAKGDPEARNSPSIGFPGLLKSLRRALALAERGKTISNNMDILDFWKCHICVHADYLFLIVPKRRQSKRRDSSPFQYVQKRITAFFDPPNYVNVNAVHLFGY